MKDHRITALAAPVSGELEVTDQPCGAKQARCQRS